MRQSCSETLPYLIADLLTLATLSKFASAASAESQTMSWNLTDRQLHAAAA